MSNHIEEILAEECCYQDQTGPYGGDYDIMNSRDFESWKEFEDDNAPYGFGIESWEDAPRCAALRAHRQIPAWLLSDAHKAHLLEKATTTYNPRLARAAAAFWNRCVDEAPDDPYKGPKQARERYKAWARKVVGKYRKVRSKP